MKKQIEVKLLTSWVSGWDSMVYKMYDADGNKYELPQLPERNENGKFVIEVEVEEVAKEVKKKEAKPAKLSPTMQKVMDKLKKADWYYMHNRKTCEYFATENGIRHIGFEGAGIVEGGYVYATMDSKTLEALSKRGVVEIARDGKQSFDAVKVVGMELPKRLEKAIKVKITRFWGDSEQTFDAFATSRNAIKYLIEHLDGPRDVVVTSVETVGEVELDVWDLLKNK
jgi:hypothetical protein